MKVTKQNIAPAYLDTDLQDRAGELWDDIPGLDGYYQISNFGRIKRIEREIFDSQGGHYILPAKIRLAQINKSPNRFKHDITVRLQIAVQTHNRKRTFMIHRIVYYCFVAPFNLDDNNLNVITKDGNGLNIWPDNLLLVTAHEKCERTFKSGRLPSPSEIDPNNQQKAVKASTRVTSKEISQYDLEGHLIKTFKSIEEASRYTRISHTSIITIANNPNKRAIKFYWRYGNEDSLDIIKIKDNWTKTHHRVVGKAVTKFDLDGNPLAQYDAISLAAKENSISHKCITRCAKGEADTTGGYRWKFGHQTQRIPPVNLCQ